ncbi:MAG: hypothetical protein MJ219_03650 [Mycoplasmoidaceae bacterium]|nr:hypothetical protein [Mycoplasmoidaceae bacterium]
MKNKKFMLGLATATVALPLVGMMTGCTQNTTSNVAKLNKINNKQVPGEKADLYVYLEDNTFLGKYEDIIPQDPIGGKFTFNLPDEVRNHGKVIDTSREAT